MDTETTGLDAESDEVIELAMLPFDYHRDSGRIVSVHVDAALSGLREPSIPIPPESTRIHGIAAADVAGKSIDPVRIAALLDEAQLVIAHNAAFDRPMVETHWPQFADNLTEFAASGDWVVNDSGLLGLRLQVSPRVWGEGAWAGGTENFDTLSIDQLGSFDAHTLRAAMQIDFGSLTSIGGAYEYQWRQYDQRMMRVTAGLVQRF